MSPLTKIPPGFRSWPNSLPNKSDSVHGSVRLPRLQAITVQAITVQAITVQAINGASDKRCKR